MVILGNIMALKLVSIAMLNWREFGVCGNAARAFWYVDEKKAFREKTA